ncbi:MAG: hypothetical protein ABI681_00200 [Gemmatimonadales bacterium]
MGSASRHGSLTPPGEFVRPPVLSADVKDRLREAFASCRTTRTLTPEAGTAIVELCTLARRDHWTPEQVIVTVKEACYSAPEVASLASTGERDAFLSRIVTACIKEFFRPDASADRAD